MLGIDTELPTEMPTTRRWTMNPVSYEVVTLMMRERDAAARMPRRNAPNHRSSLRSAAGVIARRVHRGHGA